MVSVLRGRNQHGASIKVLDQQAEKLTRLARIEGEFPEPILNSADIFGDLSKDPVFIAEVKASVMHLESEGVSGMLRKLRA